MLKDHPDTSPPYSPQHSQECHSPNMTLGAPREHMKPDIKSSNYVPNSYEIHVPQLLHLGPHLIQLGVLHRKMSTLFLFIYTNGANIHLLLDHTQLLKPTPNYDPILDHQPNKTFNIQRNLHSPQVFPCIQD